MTDVLLGIGHFRLDAPVFVEDEPLDDFPLRP